jgi:cytochrome c oxidase subunit 4
MIEEEVTPVRTYVLVALALMLLTIATIAASYLNIGRWHSAVALGLATAKALLVLLYFMNVRRSGALMRITIIVALFWLGILLLGTLNDYLTRTWLALPGH